MKYFSLDIETTGLNPETCQILQVAMVFEDTALSPLPSIEALPYFNCFVKHPIYKGDAYALALNSWILDELSGRKAMHNIPKINRKSLVKEMKSFITKHVDNDRVNIAGKNVAGFDLSFFTIEEKGHLRIRHRCIDPGSLFIQWNKECIPSLEEITHTTVAHDALQDARDVISVLRRTYP